MILGENRQENPKNEGMPSLLSFTLSCYYLLLAQVISFKTAHYIICLRRDDLFNGKGKHGRSNYLGKLRATSTSRMEYVLYDSGENPAVASLTGILNESKSEVDSPHAQENAETGIGVEDRGSSMSGAPPLRKDLGVIVYNFDKSAQKTGARRMEVAIPQVQGSDKDSKPVLWQPRDAKGSIRSNFGRVRYQGAQNSLLTERIFVMHQRESRYDPLSSCLVDFRGRATSASVKNFQLIKSPPADNATRVRYYSEGSGKGENDSDEYPRPVLLQMGKVGKNCFNVDVLWPLSLFQAFAICLSRFDTHAQF
ncbi:unnamed protein product [Choristocarpus tenellus]